MKGDSGATPPPSNRWYPRLLLALVVLVLLPIALALAYAQPLARNPGGTINSDLLQPFLVARDSLADPGNILSWRHSPALYLVPDLLLATLLVALPIPWTMIPLVYSGVLLGLYSLATGWLLRVADLTRSVATGAIAFAGALGLGYVFIQTQPTDTAYAMVMFLGQPFIHTGAILLGLAYIAAATAQRLAPSPARVTVMLLLVALGTYSDRLFVLWFVLPVIAVNILARRQWPLHWPTQATVLAVAVLSAAVDSYLRPTGIAIDSLPLQAPGVWWEGFVAAVTAGKWHLPAVVVLSLAMSVRAIVLLGRPTWTRWTLVEISLAAAQLAALATPLVTGTLVDFSNIRYSLAAFLLPLVWLVALGFAASSGRRWPVLAAAGAAWITFAASIPYGLAAAAASTAPNALVTCLLDRGLRDGFGDYWTAKKLIFDSQYRLHLVQLTDLASLYRYNYNDRWFTQRALTGEPLSPKFIITSGIRRDELASRFGAPQTSIDCAGHEIWLYDRPLTP